jgi:phage terminase large subunit GpA-like protein
MSNRLAESLKQSFRFDVQPSVVRWLEDNISIPAEMSPRTPGKFSTRSRPFMRDVLECWHPDSGVRSCTVAGGSQLLKTTVLVLGVCYRIKFSPLPIMVVGPAEKWAQREISERRLHPLINENEVLRWEKPFNPDQFKLLSMNMAGGPVIVVGANSSTSLAGSTQGIVAIDEGSKIEHTHREDAPEAHPIKNALERTKDFKGQDFHYLSSTPNHSKHLFWESFLKGDQSLVYVPCPHCGEFFAFEFEEDKSEIISVGEVAENPKPQHYRSLVWSPEARSPNGVYDYEKVLATARYICPHNGCEISDREKPKMLEAYEVKPTNKHAATGERSFRMPSFLSPSIRFGDMAWKFLDKGDLFNTGLQTFFNSWLALPFDELDLNIKDDDVWSCKAEGDLSYLKGTVPVTPRAIGIAADIGQAQSHWAAGAIDQEDNVWVIDYGTVLGITDFLSLRKQLIWPRRGKPDEQYRPGIGLVDSGDWTERVYQMCQRSERFWWPTKGSDASFGGWNKTEVKRHPGLALYTFVDKTLKDDLYEQRIFKKTAPRIFFPTDVSADFIAGLSGQQRIESGVKGKWKKVAHDHFGDAVKQLVLLSWVLRATTGPGSNDPAGDLAARTKNMDENRQG